ncbi:MAG: hypothetical protein GWN14_02880, partial [candidate division Zixibacteria bacterium]|nr:hypothetical protein [Gammaproteobacteria bacterium]NIX54887.1 hypothetical protein [candidate division Zixibacteria bacterium]
MHKYYYEMKTSDNQTVRYPASGYLIGPSVEMLTGYNIVGIARDTSASDLDSINAFGTAKGYRWNPAIGFYEYVTAAVPVKPGEGYFVLNENITLPEHGLL